MRIGIRKFGPKGPLFAFTVLLATGAAGFIACSSSRNEDVAATSSVAEKLTVSSSNIPVAFTGSHETTVAYVHGAGGSQAGPAPGRWIVAANNGDTSPPTGYGVWSWGYSTDGNATSWKYFTQTSSTQFGCPNNAACPGTPSPADATKYFNGWRGDPVLAPVTGNWSNSEKRVVGVNIAATTGADGGGYGQDVIVALSDDGGESWANLQWVDTNSTNGGNADKPYVFSNPAGGDTYVSWMDNYVGYLRKIQYGTSTPITFTGGPVITIPKTATDSSVNGFDFAFGKLPSACTSGSTGIFVVYTNDPRICNRSGNREGNATVYWNVAIYDTGNGTWIGPTTLASDPTYWSCAGFPLSSAYSNSSFPHIAANPSNSDFWMVHTLTTSTGIRAQVENGYVSCG